MTDKAPVLIVPPDSLIMESSVDKPPALTGTLLEQRKELVEAWVGQTYNLHQCNIDKQELRKWKAEQEEVYGGGNKK